MPQEQNCWELAYTYGWGYPRADTIWPKVKTTHTRGGYMLGHSCCTLCTLFLPIPDRERAVFKYLAVNLRGCGQSHLGWMRRAKVLRTRLYLRCRMPRPSQDCLNGNSGSLASMLGPGFFTRFSKVGRLHSAIPPESRSQEATWHFSQVHAPAESPRS
jgi:hypothetical protein